MVKANRAALLVAAAATATIAASAPAAAADVARLAAAYGARPSAWGVQLSPDGDKIVYFAPAGTRGTAAVVADIATGATTVLVSNPDNSFQARWCGWKSQQRIICSFTAFKMVSGFRAGFSRLLSMAADGSSTIELGVRPSDRDVQLAGSSGQIIDWLPDDPKRVIMSVYMVEKETVGTLVASPSGQAAKFVDVENNRMSTIEAPNQPTLDYGSDGRGNVRFKVTGNRDIDGYYRDNAVMFVRAKASRDWRKLGGIVFSARNKIEFAGFDDSGDNFYLLKELDDRLALYKLAADGSDRTELVLSNPIVDIDGLLRIGKYNRPVATAYTLDLTTYKFFDAVLEKRSRALSNALPGRPPVYVFDESWDGTRNLIFAGGVDDPGTYYRFDTTTKQLSPLVARRPDLAELKPGVQTPVSYTTADGIKVPAYLTLPPGGQAKGLPAIILPHGGPGYRDSQGFDWLVQYWTQLGYAVLQPNFRGSDGYGAAWYQKNGFKSWKTAIGDVNDGARWLVAQGIANPKQVSIFGWSYGGYAALQANVLDPALYRAAVAVAPVTDLQLLKDSASRSSTYQIILNFVGDGPHITEGSPAKNAAKINVPVLIFQGDQDLNVDPRQAKAMDSALASAGKQHRLVMYPGLDHQLDDSAARADMLKQSAEFIAAALAR